VKRKRTVRRGRKTNAFTSQSGSGGGLRYKSKKTSRSAYNKLLWNSSTLSTHYRSVAAQVLTPATPVLATQMTIAITAALSNGSAFWTTGGGAINPDSSNSLPVFTGNILVRGGLMGLRLANTFDTTDANRNTLHGSIMLIRTTKDWTPSAITGVVPVGWDPSYIQDFNTRIGHIVYKKNFLLRDADTALVEYRHKIRKYDQADYFQTLNQYVWVVICGAVDVNAARNFTMTNYYNLSFCGDGV